MLLGERSVLVEVGFPVATERREGLVVREPVCEVVFREDGEVSAALGGGGNEGGGFGVVVFGGEGLRESCEKSVFTARTSEEAERRGGGQRWGKGGQYLGVELDERDFVVWRHCESSPVFVSSSDSTENGGVGSSATYWMLCGVKEWPRAAAAANFGG